MLYIPTWPSTSSRAPTRTRNKPGSTTHALAAWPLRIWRAMCENAQRPERQVPYY